MLRYSDAYHYMPILCMYNCFPYDSHTQVFLFPHSQTAFTYHYPPPMFILKQPEHLRCSSINEYTVTAFFVDTDQELLDFPTTSCRFTIGLHERITDQEDMSIQVGYRGYTDAEFNVLRSTAPHLIHSWQLWEEDDERFETVWMVCPLHNHSSVRGFLFIN